MDLNPKELLNISEKDFEKEYEKAQIIDIDAELNAIQTATRKDDLGLPLLTGYERTAIKKKLRALQLILTDIKTTKLEEETQQIKKQGAQYSEQAAKRHVFIDKDVRYCYDDIIVTMQFQGTRKIPLDAVQFITATSTEIAIPCQSKRNRKFDLTKIPAQYWRMLEQHKMTPIFFTIERSGMLDKKGNLIPYWSNQKDYDAVVGQRQISPTVLALMVV
jgi:hypothetical protein